MGMLAIKPPNDYPIPPMDNRERMGIFLENQGKLAFEEFQKHPGKWVAIRWDGLAILDSDSDLVELGNRLRQRGIDPQDAVYDYVPESGAIMIQHGSEIELIREAESPK